MIDKECRDYYKVILDNRQIKNKWKKRYKMKQINKFRNNLINCKLVNYMTIIKSIYPA